jgi:hypothetical protein
MIRLLPSLGPAFALLAFSLACFGGLEPSPGMRVETVFESDNIHAFTHDEHGTPWFIATQDGRFIIRAAPSPGAARNAPTFDRIGSRRSSLLVHSNTLRFSDANAIRSFRLDRQAEEPRLELPPHLFPSDAEIEALAWSPLGDIVFSYRSSRADETGLGRVGPDNSRWDVIAKGLTGQPGFTPAGFPVIADTTSSHVFRVALGLDYQRGLENYRKSDLALRLAEPAGLALTPTDNSWLIYNPAAATLQEFDEKEGRLDNPRRIARLSPSTVVSAMQSGPDGAIWLLLNSDVTPRGSVVRLFKSPPARLADLTLLSSEALVAGFTHFNAWQLGAALRILDQRAELRDARGLHPQTPLHSAFQNTNNSAIARVHTLLSLHRLALLDEVLVESAAEDPQPLVRAWAALLLGELKPAYSRILLAALEGLQSGLPRRKVPPTDRSLQVLRDLARSDRPEIAQLSREILGRWAEPLPK